MPVFDAAVFDLDGTLLNTLSDLAAAVNRTLIRHGYPPHTEREIRSFLGDGARNLMARSLPDGERTPNFDAIFDTFFADYSARYQEKTAPYAGILPMLQNLRAAGVKIAVVTNKLQAPSAELCAAHFGDLVSCVIGDSPEHRRKPEPDGVFSALSTLGVLPERAVFVGDSEVDAETGRRAGIPSIAVLWGFRDLPDLTAAAPTYMVSDPAALEKIILGK